MKFKQVVSSLTYSMQCPGPSYFVGGRGADDTKGTIIIAIL